MPVSAPVLGALAAVTLLMGVAAFAAVSRVRSELAGRGPEGRAMLGASAGVALMVLGLRLTLGSGQVSWCPFLDQWHAEIGGVLAPLARGTLSWGDLWAGNNEHRVFLTRVLALVVTLVNGGWDNRPLVLGNYLLESLMVGWVALLAWLSLGWIRGFYVAVAAMLPMALVCNWEVLVSSNQTQFVVMAVGTVFALSVIGGAAVRPAAAAGSLALAVLMLGSMASGLLTAAVLAAIVTAGAFVTRRWTSPAVGLAAAGVVLAIAGWVTRVPFSALEFLHARDLGQWTRAFLAYAAWPLPPGPGGVALLWIPWGVLLARTRRGLKPPALASFALGLGLWALLQSAALAWSRCGLGGLISSRYTEFVGLGVLANAAALAVIFQPRHAGSRPHAGGWGVMLLWLAVVGGAQARESVHTYQPYLDAFHAHALGQERRLAEFVRTGDAGPIEAARFPDIPYWAPDILAVLRDPRTDALLPVALRPWPAPVGPLTRLAIGAFRLGPGLAAAGALLMVGAFLGWLFGGEPVTPPRRRASPGVPAVRGTSREFSLPPRA
jgi:hypothetical protein